MLQVLHSRKLLCGESYWHNAHVTGCNFCNLHRCSCCTSQSRTIVFPGHWDSRISKKKIDNLVAADAVPRKFR